MICDARSARGPVQFSATTAVSAPYSPRRASNEAASSSLMGTVSMDAEKQTVQWL